jgi:hypothetical protein
MAVLLGNNGSHYDQRERQTLQEFQKIMRPYHARPGRSFALYLILLGLAAGCETDTGETGAVTADCVDDGELTARVYGAIETNLEWRDDDLECDGMPRPHGQGARLRFAGPATANGQTLNLAFIIALPGLKQGRSADELPAGVTLIEENAGRFFSTPEPSTCWADIEHQLPLQTAAADATPEYRIKGLLYCLSPLAEVNGKRSVTFTDLHFAGRLDWRAPE